MNLYVVMLLIVLYGLAFLAALPVPVCEQYSRDATERPGRGSPSCQGEGDSQRQRWVTKMIKISLKLASL